MMLQSKSIRKCLGLAIGLAAFSFGQTPQIFQDFKPWSGNTSPDGIFTKSGPWVGTGGNTLTPANVTFTPTYGGETDSGFMYLTSKANQLNGAEVWTKPNKYKYGYYETRMKVTNVGDPVANKGVCASFFLWDDQNGNLELDVEILTNGSWITSANSGQVTFSYHLDNGTGSTHYQNLTFNPSMAFHRYGILWQAGRVDWTVDGQIVYGVSNAQFTNNNTEYIMLNSWTGNANWGGLAPSTDATTTYDWVKFWPGVTGVPSEAQTQIISKSLVPPSRRGAALNVFTGANNAFVKFTMPEKADVSVELFSFSGAKAATLYNGSAEPGEHTVAVGQRNLIRSSQYYLVRMKTGAQVLANPFVMVGENNR